MRLQLVSDLHIEFQADHGESFLKSIPVAADTLVIAGDTVPLQFFSQVKARLEAFTKRWRQTLLVLGNHEYYGSSVDETEHVAASLENVLPNLKVLRPGRVFEVEGRRVLGATLWFRDDYMNNMYAEGMSDFHVIKGFVPWVYAANQTAMTFFQKEMQEGDVVVTHHLPSVTCVAERFKHNALNRFFVCEMDELIHERKPAVWAFGHSHTGCDHMVGSTRMVCNPLGYPFEGSVHTFNDKLVIELP
jgi:Icc-related predicted phosphoesterase